MRKPPCRQTDGKDCPDRRVGCHSRCEAYKAFRAELDEYNAKKLACYDAADFTCRGIYRHRKGLQYSEAGRRALAQR